MRLCKTAFCACWRRVSVSELSLKIFHAYLADAQPDCIGVNQKEIVGLNLKHHCITAEKLLL